MNVNNCPYQLSTVLGQGTFGTVFKGVDKKTGNVVAIKFVKYDFCSNKPGINPGEYDILFRLRHSYLATASRILTNKEANICDQNYVQGIVMPLAEGDLESFFGKQTELNPLVAARHLARGLEALHKAGYYHLDLKPANCLVVKNSISKQLTVKISDFGLAVDRTTKVLYNMVCTPGYRPPEVKNAFFKANASIDLFSLGVILAELFVGQIKLPYVKSDEYDLKNQEHIQKEVITIYQKIQKYERMYKDPKISSSLKKQLFDILSQSWGGIGPYHMEEMSQLILKLTSLNPKDRPNINDVVTIIETMFVGQDLVVPQLFIMPATRHREPLPEKPFNVLKKLMGYFPDSPVRVLFCAYDLYIRENDSEYINKTTLENVHCLTACLSIALDIHRYFVSVENVSNEMMKKCFKKKPDRDFVEYVCSAKRRMETSPRIKGIFNPINVYDTANDAKEIKAMVESFEVLKAGYNRIEWSGPEGKERNNFTWTFNDLFR